MGHVRQTERQFPYPGTDRVPRVGSLLFLKTKTLMKLESALLGSSWSPHEGNLSKNKIKLGKGIRDKKQKKRKRQREKERPDDIIWALESGHLMLGEPMELPVRWDQLHSLYYFSELGPCPSDPKESWAALSPFQQEGKGQEMEGAWAVGGCHVSRSDTSLHGQLKCLLLWELEANGRKATQLFIYSANVKIKDYILCQNCSHL